MSRWIRFIIAILIGIGLGLFYGWVIDPVEYIDTTPDSLRQDYKTDYVLMVAEIYQSERDPSMAERRLNYLGSGDPLEVVRNAEQYATQVGYSQRDLAALEELMEVLQTRSSETEGSLP